MGRAKCVVMALWVLGLWGGVEGRGLGWPGVQEPACSPALFVFGASYVDVGENAAAMPFREPSEREPYGLDYFDGKPTGRFSNGRVITDHICECSCLALTLVLPHTFR
jgi:hypothetical protein